jgi:hypothetical protein
MDTSVHIATVEASCDVPTTMEAAITVASRHQTIRPAQISIASIAAMHSRQPLGVKNGYGGRSSGTSAVLQIADYFGAPRKSAEVGLRTNPPPREKAARPAIIVGG